MEKNNQKKSVLVVDDSEDNLYLLKLLLSRTGCEVHTASHGAEALSLLKELNVLPGLILLDAQMPVMDGYQFRVKQAASDRLKGIPVIVMTADPDLSVKQDMLEPEEVITKPINFDSFLNSVERYI